MAENTNPQEEKPKRRRVKKVKGGHGGHHGGAWKVAYADFVTAMMALFLVLWLVSQADTKLKQEIANYFRSPGVFSSTKGGILSGPKKVSREPNKLTAKDEEQMLFEAARRLKQKIDSRESFSKLKDKVKIDIVKEGIKVQVLDKADNISFQVGGSTLNEEAKEILREIAQTICSLPNPIKIGGHTDARVFPSNNGYTNWELSTDRANAARRFLQSVCVKPEQILRITGYADTIPLDPRDAYAPKNRRISITILKMTQEDTSDDEDSESKEDGEEITTDEPTEDNETSETKKDVKKPKVLKLSKKKQNKKESEKEDSSEDKKDKKESSKKETEEKPKKNKSDTKNKKEKSESLKEKLAREGKVEVGKPDVVPKVAKKRESKSTKPDQ